MQVPWRRSCTSPLPASPGLWKKTPSDEKYTPGRWACGKLSSGVKRKAANGQDSGSENLEKQLPKEQTTVILLRTSSVRLRIMGLILQAESYLWLFWSRVTYDQSCTRRTEWQNVCGTAQSGNRKAGLLPKQVGEIRAHYRGLPLKCWSSEVWGPLLLPTQFQYQPMSEELKHNRILTSFSYWIQPQTYKRKQLKEATFWSSALGC